jgi:hypothetical protein
VELGTQHNATRGVVCVCYIVLRACVVLCSAELFGVVWFGSLSLRVAMLNW